MKIAVFSDVHGNLPAFEETVKSIEKEGADRLIFCGDICGYYYDQNEVIKMLLAMKNLTCIAGNHDRLFLESLNDDQLLENYSQKYGSSFYDLKKNITPQSMEYLKGLPESYTDKKSGIAVFHGSPRDPLNEYVYPTDPIDAFADLPYRFVFLGHTHYPMVRQINGLNVINPGSCGQPRGGNIASYAVVDTDTGKTEIKGLGTERKAQNK
jgi:predicted phosphodiesterase